MVLRVDAPVLYTSSIYIFSYIDVPTIACHCAMTDAVVSKLRSCTLYPSNVLIRVVIYHFYRSFDMYLAPCIGKEFTAVYFIATTHVFTLYTPFLFSLIFSLRRGRC